MSYFTRILPFPILGFPILSRPEWRTFPALNKRSFSAENAEGLMDEAFMMVTFMPRLLELVN